MTITKERAIEILSAANNPRSPGFSLREAVYHLDRAGAFPDEATLAEIDEQARYAFADERSEQAGHGRGKDGWRRTALLLATACRKAGLVKP